jgi:phosphatidylserine/phosphatidylglycerophosphate/cardiolipin synthase-like enzyme
MPMNHQMRKKLLLAIAFSLGIWVYVLVLAAGPHAGAASANLIGPEDGMTAFFSPNGGCTPALIEEINKANQSIDIQAYTFTSSDIAQALAAAVDRNVKVRVILDKRRRSDRDSQAIYFQSRHIGVFIDDHHPVAGNKVMLIDGKVLVTGSFNFSRESEDMNAENMLIIHDRPKLIGQYQANFEQHLNHSIPMGAAAK